MAYTVQTCNEMIAHYSAQALNTEKPASWRALARTSVAEWQVKLERAKGA
jgi:hypothetical protein